MSIKNWNVAIARYNKKVDGVAEKTILRNIHYKDAIGIVHKINKPLCAYHSLACSIEPMAFAVCENNLYKKEYQKLKD